MPNNATIRGQVQVYTGEGKGKTTAALGLAIRAAGHGRKVAIVYFDKGGDFYGERKILDRLSGMIDYHVSGLPRFDVQKKTFRFGVTDDDRKEAERGMDLTEKLAQSGKYQLIVLDEVNTSMHLGMISAERVLKFIAEKPESLELVLTGRNCPEQVQSAADLVTEMRPVKHYMTNGVPAREGIEY